MSDPKKKPAADPSGEVTPGRPDNREGARKSNDTQLIDRGETDARIDERRPESDAHEQPDGGPRREQGAGYRNSDETI